jgi:hypothetical protein
LIEINGSRNFRHIRQALRAAQRAACLALAATGLAEELHTGMRDTYSDEAEISENEFFDLFAVNSEHAPDALVLLCWLKMEFGPAATFTLSPSALKRANEIAGWTLRQYDTAFRHLIQTGFLRVATMKGRRIEYQLSTQGEPHNART